MKGRIKTGLALDQGFFDPEPQKNITTKRLRALNQTKLDAVVPPKINLSS